MRESPRLRRKWYSSSLGQHRAGKGMGRVNVRWIWHGKEYVQLTEQIAKKKLQKTLDILADQAKRDCPVDTGFLRDSIRTWEPRQRGRMIHGAYGIPTQHTYQGKTLAGDDFMYGFYQEVGFIHARAKKHIRNSYLVPALYKKKPEIEALWRVS